jgi:putative hydrolase of the HAD superfamily
MKPKVVTFDCANTLVRVRWSPGGFAVDCARAIGIDISDEERILYERSLRARWSEYQEINKSRDPELGDAFWLNLAANWMTAIGRAPELALELVKEAPGLLYDKSSTMFELFDDVLPTLDGLDRLGIRLGVISNWDYSLHRVLKALDVHHRFEHVVASLEEGIEKPDIRLFHLTLEKFGACPAECLHIGDDPLDDLQGAKEAGMRAMLIDRSHSESRPPYLIRLTDLVSMVS